MNYLFKLSGIVGIVASFCGGLGIYLCNALDSSADTANAFLVILAIGLIGLGLVILKFLWRLIIKLVYDLALSVARGIKDGKDRQKKTLR